MYRTATRAPTPINEHLTMHSLPMREAEVNGLQELPNYCHSMTLS
jgi:hypothetical protein